MRHFAALLTLLAFAVLTGACGDYANSVRKDIGLPNANGPNPQNLPNANHVPKPTPPPGYTITLSPVVIQEVMLDAAGQYVELYNATSQPTDIGGWMLSDGYSSHTFPYGFTVQGDTRVVVHLGGSGVDSATEQFSPSFSQLQPQGSLALLQGGIDLVNFVQWGADNQNYEFTADQLGEWTAGDYALTPNQGLSLHYNGTANNSSAWYHDNPNPGN